MYKVTLTTSETNTPVTLYFTTNLAVCTCRNTNSKELEVRVMDGLHNNCGWSVNESYEEVIAKIDEAISIK
jgi:hypothetical protein